MGDAEGVPQLITSAANPTVKLARQLATRRRARLRERLFLIEGQRAIDGALQHGVTLQTLLLDNERRGDIAPALVSAAIAAGARVVALSEPLFSSIAEAEHPQAAIAIAALPASALPRDATCIVALDAVRDPGNLGTIVRTAAAAGVDGIGLLPGCVDPFSPKAVRASAGMVAAIPIEPVPSLADLLNRCFTDSAATEILAADADGSRHYRDVDWKKPLVLIVGNESRGVSDEQRRQATQLVHIPIARGVESLNVAVATGVLLFEMRARREGR